MSYAGVIGFHALCVTAGLAVQLYSVAFVLAGTQDYGTRTSRLEEPFALKLSLADAIQAALDNNPNVKLYREKIEAARSATKTQLGALLPNLSSQGKFNNQTFFFGTIGGAPVRSQPFNIIDGRGTLSQSLFSLSLIDRWRASHAAFQVAELEAVATQNDTMATVALHYFDILRIKRWLLPAWPMSPFSKIWSHLSGRVNRAEWPLDWTSRDWNRNWRMNGSDSSSPKAMWNERR